MAMGTRGRAPTASPAEELSQDGPCWGREFIVDPEGGRGLQTDLGFLCPPPCLVLLLFPSFHLGGIARLHPLLSGISIVLVGSPTMCPGVTHQQQTVKRKKIGWKYQCTLVTINPAFNLC